eukprot:573391-Pyramimonas_sp.AAC.1
MVAARAVSSSSPGASRAPPIRATPEARGRTRWASPAAAERAREAGEPTVRGRARRVGGAGSWDTSTRYTWRRRSRESK